MYTCICTYVCIYMHTYTYVRIYDKRALSSMVTSAWCGGEAPWLSFACLLVSFVQYVRGTTKTSGLARTVCSCTRVCSIECMSAWLCSKGGDACVARAGPAFNARWCTGCSLWLMPPVFGRGMHYQQSIYTLCEYVLPPLPPNSHTYAPEDTCTSLFSSSSLIAKCRYLSVRVWESECVGRGWGESVWQFGHFKCV